VLYVLCCVLRFYGEIKTFNKRDAEIIHIFMIGSEGRIYFETECIMAVQGHPRSLLSEPIKSMYMQ